MAEQKTTSKTTAAKTTAPAPAPAVKTEAPFTFAVVPSDVVLKVQRDEKPNPLLDSVKASIRDGSTLQVKVPNAERSTEAANHLRRAAKTLGCGLSMREDHAGGRVIFKAKPEKSKRKYTAADIRVWGKANGATEDMLSPRIRKDVRDAFKKAHGYVKDDSAE